MPKERFHSVTLLITIPSFVSIANSSSTENSPDGRPYEERTYNTTSDRWILTIHKNERVLDFPPSLFLPCANALLDLYCATGNPVTADLDDVVPVNELGVLRSTTDPIKLRSLKGTARQCNSRTHSTARNYSRTQLKSYHLESLDDSTSGEGVLSDPLVMASDVAAQISFLPKLKYSSAERRKETKVKLAEKQEDVRTLAPLVEQDYEKARSMTSLATSLSVKILNAKLSAASPPASAPHSQHSNSDARHTDCADASAELQGLEKRIEESKGKLKAEMEEVERLRVAERERTAELG
ncbi:hypothetical protein J3A83DRAFT_4184622 [Scleroderma citrinum]